MFKPAPQLTSFLGKLNCILLKKNYFLFKEFSKLFLLLTNVIVQLYNHLWSSQNLFSWSGHLCYLESVLQIDYTVLHIIYLLGLKFLPKGTDAMIWIVLSEYEWHGTLQTIIWNKRLTGLILPTTDFLSFSSSPSITLYFSFSLLPLLLRILNKIWSFPYTFFSREPLKFTVRLDLRDDLVSKCRSINIHLFIQCMFIDYMFHVDAELQVIFWGQ